MAIPLFKWFSAAIVLFMHPFYVCVTEINHNADDQTLELSTKAFADDFEKVLSKKYNTRIDFVHPKDKSALDKLISDYIRNHLAIKADGKAVSFTYLGFEKEEDAVYCYLQIEKVKTIKSLEVVDSMLHDLNDNQINIIHVVVGGKRKSTKLNFPDTRAEFNF